MEKTIYLTFDDGPSETTPLLLALLDRLGVKAAFFVTNRYRCPQLIREIASRGHVLCLHSYCHEYDRIYASPEAYFGDLEELEALLWEQAPAHERIVRFPGGADNTVHRHFCPGIMPALLRGLYQKGYVEIDWDIENGDGMNRGETREVYAQNAIRSLERCRAFWEDGYAVYLSHTRPGDEESIRAVEDFVLFCKDRGYRFDTVDKIKYLPRYFAADAEGRLFTAHTIERVLARSGIRREWNEAALFSYLQYGYVAGEETFYRGVYRCLPRPLDGARLRTDLRDEADIADRIDHTIRRLMEGKTGAALLSSGVDSSYMLAASDLREAYGIGFGDPGTDERPDAARTAKQLGREFIGTEGTREQYAAALEILCQTMEQPMADASLPAFYLLCRTAAETHKTLFCAEGIDELFGGYYSYGRFASADFANGLPYFGAGHFLMPFEVRRLLKAEYDDPMNREQRRIFDSETGSLTKMLRFDTEFYLMGHTAVYADEISRMVGARVALPFVNDALIGLAFSVPEACKQDKRIFRKAAQTRLPEACAFRKKMGFPVPVRAWMSEPRTIERIRETLLGELSERFFCTEEVERLLCAFRADGETGWKALFALYVFVRWYETHWEICGEQADRSPSRQEPGRALL